MKEKLFEPSLKIKKEDYIVDKKVPLLNGHTRKCSGCGITVGESWEKCGMCETAEIVTDTTKKYHKLYGTHRDNV